MAVRLGFRTNQDDYFVLHEDDSTEYVCSHNVIFVSIVLTGIIIALVLALMLSDVQFH